MSIFDFGKPNIRRLKKTRNVDGLVQASRYKIEEDPLKGTASKVRMDAIEALNDLAFVRLSEKGAIVQHHRIDEIIFPRTRDAIINAVQDPSKDVRRDATSRVREMHKLRLIDATMACDGFVNALHHPAEEVRSDAISELRELWDGRAIDPLISMLQDPAEKVRWHAIWALRATRDARSIDPLIIMLQDPAEKVRDAATCTLGKFADARAIDPLISMLQDPNEEVRLNAIWALGKIGDARAVDALTGLLQDPAAKVRIAGVWALVNIADARVIDILTSMLQDPAWLVRWKTAKALRAVGHPIIDPLAAAFLDPALHESWRSDEERLGPDDVSDSVERVISTEPDDYWGWKSLGVNNQYTKKCINIPCEICGKKPSQIYAFSCAVSEDHKFSDFGEWHYAPSTIHTGDVDRASYFCDHCLSWEAEVSGGVSGGEKEAIARYIRYQIRKKGDQINKKRLFK